MSSKISTKAILLNSALIAFLLLPLMMWGQKDGSKYRFKQAPIFVKKRTPKIKKVPKAKATGKKLASAFERAMASVVLLRNEGELVPLKRLDQTRIAYLSVGLGTDSKFEKTLKKYADIEVLTLPEKNQGKAALEWAAQFEDKFDLFIIGVEDRYTEDQVFLKKHFSINALIQKYKCITVVFGGKNAFQYLRLLNQSAVLINTADEMKFSESLAGQLIFGGIGSENRLNLSLSKTYIKGTGLSAPTLNRLRYSPPDFVGMNPDSLDRNISRIVEYGLKEKAYPGAQVLVAKSGHIVYHKAFGYHTYDQQRPVQLDDIYDFASLTKVTSALPALMKFYGEDKFDLDAPLETYFPSFKSSNKKGLNYRSMLAHNARLMPWIPYWRSTVKKNGKFKGKTFKPDSSATYSVRVLENLWLHKNYKEKKIYKAIKKSPLNEEPGYVYSGLLFYLLPEIVSNLAGEDFETYLKKTIYEPIGAFSITYNAYKHFPLERIIPTERDTFFRMAQLHGTVHDEGAAMMGGVSGNAGLFGSANDLAKLMQLYMNKGNYAGQQIIPTKAVEEFSKCQFCDEGNHRGLGFDKPQIDNEDARYTAKSASSSSFGHSGYTGTFAWVDPAEELIVIFFSNRVFPTRDNRKLYELNIRPDLHQAVYNAIKKVEGRK